MKTIEVTPGEAALLDEVFGDVPPLKESDLEELAQAIRDLEDDPEYIAISLKADVITEIYHAMHEQGLTPSKLARKWGKSRQYLSKILSEDKRVNFTVDTIAEIMVLLGRRVELHFPKKGEHTAVIRCLREKPGEVSWPPPKKSGPYWTGEDWTTGFSTPLALPDFTEVAKMKKEEQSVA